MPLSWTCSPVFTIETVDSLSSYTFTPDGNISLWNIIWSPDGSIRGKDDSHHGDSIDLGVLDTVGKARAGFLSNLDTNC